MDAQLALMHIENHVELVKQLGAGISAVINMFPSIDKLENIDELESRAFTYIMHNGKGHLNPHEVKIHLEEFLKRIGYKQPTLFINIQGVEHGESINHNAIDTTNC